MRNRVAHDGARATLARAVRVTVALTVLPAALFVAGAQVASAETGVVEGRFASGTVGIIAIVLGLGGLVAGLLLRRRRLATTRTPAAPAAKSRPEPARSETAA